MTRSDIGKLQLEHARVARSVTALQTTLDKPQITAPNLFYPDLRPPILAYLHSQEAKLIDIEREIRSLEPHQEEQNPKQETPGKR